MLKNNIEAETTQAKLTGDIGTTPSYVNRLKYKGKRKYKGLYKSEEGKYINADINGSLNIMRKYLEKK